MSGILEILRRDYPKAAAEILVESLKRAEIQYGCEIPKHIIEEAKKYNLVIVTGASDDRVEFCGAIDDEGGCLGGGIINFDETHIDQNGEKLKYQLKAVWQPKNEKGKIVAAWKYKAEFPLYEFPVYEYDEIKGKELYCIGAVFSLKEVEK